jgi:hypothetical protein
LLVKIALYDLLPTALPIGNMLLLIDIYNIDPEHFQAFINILLTVAPSNRIS